MLDKALSYCLQEETPVSIADIMQISQEQQINHKQPKIMAQPTKLDFHQIQQKFIKQSSIKDMINQASQEFKQTPKITQDFTPYQSGWQKHTYQILQSQYRKQQLLQQYQFIYNRNKKEGIFDLDEYQKVNLRIRDMSMFTERKFKLESNNQF